MALRIGGRSSSHFTRTVRVFAHELGVEYGFVPILDLMSHASDDWLENPALRLPILETDEGSWFGALGICRELARRATPSCVVVWPEQLTERHAANAQELVLQGMSTEVGMLMRKLSAPDDSDRYATKNRHSLINTLVWLEQHLSTIRVRLPVERTLSFLEVTAFCFLTHLEFRQVVETDGYVNLQAFCREFATRESAQATTYRFDIA